ncbi:MAG: crotonase/enoyl-CoA hydratase family protein [Actinomycetota bacterium]
MDFEVDGDGVAVVTLDRPDSLNAFTPTMMFELLDVWDRIDEDDGVRAVIVTGRGRAFCAGADLSAGGATFDADAVGRTPSDGDAPAPRDGGGLVTLRIFRSTKPVIAAINGPAVGIGITMTLPMDIRMAADDARIGFVFARRGIVPEAASSWFLPRLVGVSAALEWCYRGDVFPVADAHEAGLVRSLHPTDELLPAARELAGTIAANAAPVSVALTRQMLWRMQGAAHPMEAHRVDSAGIYERGRSADAVEGVTAFLEKRPADFPLTVTGDMPRFYPWWDEPEYET